ncbi:hypothetical protein DFH28DRAFT_929502 [Melampsora americana]|nr:hypothetical protein DFH28DRAFT_929502 [Melampsora americana]
MELSESKSQNESQQDQMSTFDVQKVPLSLQHLLLPTNSKRLISSLAPFGDCISDKRLKALHSKTDWPANPSSSSSSELPTFHEDQPELGQQSNPCKDVKGPVTQSSQAGFETAYNLAQQSSGGNQEYDELESDASTDDSNRPFRPHIDDIEEPDNWMKLSPTSPSPSPTMDPPGNSEMAIDNSNLSTGSQVDQLDGPLSINLKLPQKQTQASACKGSQSSIPTRIPTRISTRIPTHKPACPPSRRLVLAPFVPPVCALGCSPTLLLNRSPTCLIHSMNHGPTPFPTPPPIQSPTPTSTRPPTRFLTPIQPSPINSPSPSLTPSPSPSCHAIEDPIEEFFGDVFEDSIRGSSQESNLCSYEDSITICAPLTTQSKKNSRGKAKGNKLREKEAYLRQSKEPKAAKKQKKKGSIETPVNNHKWVPALGIDYKPKKGLSEYNVDTESGWNEFVDVALSLKRDHSLGLMVRMENPESIEKDTKQFQNQINHLNSLAGQLEEDPSQNTMKRLPSLNDPNLHSGTIECLMTQYKSGKKGGSEQMRYIDPLDSTKWVRLNITRLSKWADDMIEARRNGCNDVTLFIPPKTPMFKTYIGGRKPAGVKAIHEDHPSFAPPQASTSTVPIINHFNTNSTIPQASSSASTVPNQLDHRMFLEHFCLDHWSTFIVSSKMSEDKLEGLGFSLGAAIKLISGSTRFQPYILGNIEFGSFRPIDG